VVIFKLKGKVKNVIGKEVIIMTLIKWRPKTALSTLGLDALDWFDDFYERPSVYWGGGFYPSAESYAKGNILHLRTEIPGVNPKDVDIKVEDGHICIRGERRRPESAKDSCYCFEEMCYGSFERCFHLPERVEVEKIHAKYENGMLELSIPLSESVAGKKIPIEGVEEEKKESKAA
jgi:HSP20 family protein